MTNPDIATAVDAALDRLLAAVQRTQMLVDTNIIASGICHVCFKPAPPLAIICAHCYWKRAES